MELHDRVVMVTGATGGLGRALVGSFRREGAHVVALARNRQKLDALAAEHEGIEPILVDLSDPASVRRAAQAFQAKHEKLHVLVNNAAVFTAKRRTTPNGMEAMFATNHLGPFLLTNLLEGHLKAAAPSRVLFVSAPTTTKIDFDDLQSTKRFSANRAFTASKTGNFLTAYALARRWKETGIRVDVVHPGLLRSGLLREAPAPVRWVLGTMAKPPDKPAAGITRLALDPALAEGTGRFFKLDKEAKPADYALDEQAQARLWAMSSRLSSL